MRKLTAATLALTVAGGVYLSSGTAEASNMGFKLERSFSVVRRTPADPTTAFLNIYIVAFPLFNGLGDVGETGHAGNKCVGDAGSTAAPDTIVDSTDAICDLWVDRTGSFAFSRFNRDTCQYQPQTASLGLAGVSFGGSAFALERDAGFQITVAQGRVNPVPVNRAVIVGSHDPSYTGRSIRVPTPDCVPRIDIVNLPYHTMYTESDEILCGLDGVDWVDANGDGKPDTCPTNNGVTAGGVFDGTKAIAVLTFDNVADGLGADNQYISRSVTRGLAGLAFAGTRFNLTPGDGYILSISPGHTQTLFLTPHF